MWDYLGAVFGEVTANELALVAIIFLCIVAYGWAPKVGEIVGGAFDRDEE